MYERFYNLRERPFALSPDPDYLYLSRVHREALGYLRYGIEGHAGFVVITGDIGCGKTTLLQSVLRGLDRQTSISRLVNTMLDARELIEAVMLDFGLNPPPGQSKPHLLRDLARFLVDQRSADRLALLVIDEAQNLSLAALEEVRMLSNLETEKSKLIQIVLVGQPNLRDILAKPELEQLRQRITVSYHLQTLDAAETAAYVNHRLRRAAIGTPVEFAREVTDLIYLHSQGIPRKINVIADAILLFGYGEEKRLIDVELTSAALEELQATGVIGHQTQTAPSATAAPAPPPVAPERQRELAAREARIAERETWIAEQERVLLETYRLLRSQRETAAGPSASAQRAPVAPERHVQAQTPRPYRPMATPAPSYPGAGRIVVAPPAAPAPQAAGVRPAAASRGFSVHSVPPESVWTRLRRQLLDAFKPVFEE